MALGVVELSCSAFLEGSRHFGDSDLAHEIAHENTKPCEYIGLCQERRLVLEREALSLKRDHVRQTSRIRVALEQLDRLVWQIRSQRDQLSAEALHASPRGLRLGPLIEEITDQAQTHALDRVLLDQLQNLEAREPNDHDGEAGARLDDVQHLGHTAGVEEILHTRLLEVRDPLRHHGEQPAVLGRGPNRCERGRAPDTEGNGHTRKHHRVSHGQHRKLGGDVELLTGRVDREMGVFSHRPPRLGTARSGSSC